MDRSSKITIETDAGFFETTLGELPEFVEGHRWISENSSCTFKDSGDQARLKDLLAKAAQLPEEKEVGAGDQSPEEMLALLLQRQAQQSRELAKTSFRVGCLFAYLIATLIITGIGFLVFLLQQ